WLPELGREADHHVDLLSNLRHLAQLDESPQTEPTSLDHEDPILGLFRQADDLVRPSEPLLYVLRHPECPLGVTQHRGQYPRIPPAPRHPHGLVTQRFPALVRIRDRDLLGEAPQDARPERAVAAAERGERLLQQSDERLVPDDGRKRNQGPAEAER